VSYETDLLKPVREIVATAIDLRNDSDYWEKAAMHLLYCQRPVEECERCKAIQVRLEQA